MILGRAGIGDLKTLETNVWLGGEMTCKEEIGSNELKKDGKVMTKEKADQKIKKQLKNTK